MYPKFQSTRVNDLSSWNHLETKEYLYILKFDHIIFFWFCTGVHCHCLKSLPVCNQNMMFAEKSWFFVNLNQLIASVSTCFSVWQYSQSPLSSPLVIFRSSLQNRSESVCVTCNKSNSCNCSFQPIGCGQCFDSTGYNHIFNCQYLHSKSSI